MSQIHRGIIKPIVCDMVFFSQHEEHIQQILHPSFIKSHLRNKIHPSNSIIPSLLDYIGK